MQKLNDIYDLWCIVSMFEKRYLKCWLIHNVVYNTSILISLIDLTITNPTSSNIQLKITLKVITQINKSIAIKYYVKIYTYNKFKNILTKWNDEMLRTWNKQYIFSFLFLLYLWFLSVPNQLVEKSMIQCWKSKIKLTFQQVNN